MDPRPRRSKIEKVSLDTLRVPAPGKAQRPFRQAKGDEIAGNFDIDSFGFPVVCRVENVNWLVDGQHRVYGIQQSGYAAATDQIECEVYEGLALSEMAHMFLGRNHSTPVNGFERFSVAVTAGYPIRNGDCRDRDESRPQARLCQEYRKCLCGRRIAPGIRT